MNHDNNNPHEHHVETVLAALRHAEPLPGMEQRITVTLHRLADEASVTTSWWAPSRLPHLAGYAAIVAVAVFLSAAMYRKHAAFPKDHVALRLPTKAGPDNEAAFATGAFPEKATAAFAEKAAGAFAEKAAGAFAQKAAGAFAEKAAGAFAEKAAGFSPMNPDHAHGGLQPRALSGANGPSRAQRVSGLKAAAFSANAAVWKADGLSGHAAVAKAYASPANITAATAAGPGSLTRVEPHPAAQAEQDFPAPVLPLTDQERLLVRLIHRDDPVELAQLTPAAREMERQREREQVSEFFKGPPMLPANFKLEPYPTPGGTQ